MNGVAPSTHDGEAAAMRVGSRLLRAGACACVLLTASPAPAQTVAFGGRPTETCILVREPGPSKGRARDYFVCGHVITIERIPRPTGVGLLSNAPPSHDLCDGRLCY